MSPQAIPRLCLKAILGLSVFTLPVFADISGNFKYTINGNSITITGYVTEPTGDLTLPSTIIAKPVTSIGSYAFQYCSGLSSVTIPATVTSIGVDAFGSCSSLMDLTIPSNVTSLGDRAFENCTSLGDVTIPASVTSIGSDVFRSCSGLSSFTVEATNPNYSSTDGILFNKQQTTLIQYPAQASSASYTIPSTVTRIGGTAFGNCSNLSSVTIPTSVTSIGTYAFDNCGGLTDVTIPASVTSIANFAFAECSNLAAFTVDPANLNYSSADGAFFNKLQTILIQYPAAATRSAYDIPSTVTTIGDSAFQYCYNLTSVTIPSGVFSIGNSTFSFCSNLANVTIPSAVTNIGAYAFEECGLLTVTIPANVTSIGNLAFYHCVGLSSATFLGNAPTDMGFYVFDDAASGFTIYYTSGSKDFTSPTWMGYPAAATGGSSPLASWQAANGLSPSVDMLSTPNHDGVSLLMDYALGLNPNTNESANLPKLIVAGNTLQISFSCDTNRTDVIYTVQASSTLASGDWENIAESTGGAVVQSSNPLITISDSGTGARTATVSVSKAALPQGHGFLRLKVSAS